jgi:hypothetical protein
MIVRETIVAAVLARLQAIPGLAFSDLLPTSAPSLYRSVVVAVLASPDRLGEVAGGVVQTVTEGPLNISVASLATARTVSFTVNFDIQFINRSHDPNLP